LQKTGSGLKTAGEITGEGARRAGGGIKSAAGSAAAGAVTIGGAVATGVVTAGGAVAGTATEVGAIAWNAVDDRVEAYWDVIRRTVIETAGETIHSTVTNDATMERIYKAVYLVLPSDIRRWVSEEQFIIFCMKSRDRFVGAALPVSPAAVKSP